MQQQRKAPGHQQRCASGTARLSCVSCCQTVLIVPLYLLRGCVTQKGPEATWDRLQFREGCAGGALLAQHNWSLEVEEGEVWVHVLCSPLACHAAPAPWVDRRRHLRCTAALLKSPWEKADVPSSWHLYFYLGQRWIRLSCLLIFPAVGECCGALLKTCLAGCRAAAAPLGAGGPQPQRALASCMAS